MRENPPQSTCLGRTLDKEGSLRRAKSWCWRARESRRWRGLAVALALFPWAVQGQTVAQEKEAWEYTFEERLALRFDEGKADVGFTVAQPSSRAAVLPWEAFTKLMFMAFGSDAATRSATRMAATKYLIRENLESVAYEGRVVGFWALIEELSWEYIEDHLRASKLTRQAALLDDEDQIQELLDRAQVIFDGGCHKRAKAFQRVKDAIGEVAFMQFLYSDAAPRGSLVMSLDEGQDVAQRMRYIEGGCQ